MSYKQITIYRNDLPLYTNGYDAAARSNRAGIVGAGTYYVYGTSWDDGFRPDLYGATIFPIDSIPNRSDNNYIGWVNLSEDLQATTPSAPSSVTMGNDITITLIRQRSDFTHTLKYKIGDKSGTIGTGIGISQSWTVPTSLADQITKSDRGPLEIIAETYQGSKLIGTRSTFVTAYVPTTYRPTGTRTLTEVGDMPSGFAGYWVQNKSRLRISIPSASGHTGSTIQSVVTKVGDTSHTHPISGSTISPVTVDLTRSGAVACVTTFADSRGRTFEIDQSVQVEPYHTPRIHAFGVARALSNGTISQTGTFLLSTFRHTIASVGGQNTGGWRVETQPIGSSTWTTVMSGSELTFPSNVNRTSPTGILSPSTAYNVRLVVHDAFTGALPQITQKTIDAGGALISFKANDRGVEFGKSATIDDAFVVPWIGFFLDLVTAGGSVEDRLAELFGMRDLGTVADHISDWDQLALTGTFTYGGGNPSTNGPGIYGKVVSWGHGSYRAVIVIGLTEIRFRLMIESGWKPWRKITSTAI